MMSLPMDAASAEPDATVQAFTQWLAELRGKSGRIQQDLLSEMGGIRDAITSNNVELTDFKRHSTNISQQMQTQLTDLREKLTSAFSEITTLIKDKGVSDNEMMTDINILQQNLSSKTADLEALKKSYSQAHRQIQSSLIQIQNHIQVTNNEVQVAKSSCDRVYRETQDRFVEIDEGLKTLEDRLSAGSSDLRNQMLGLQHEIARIHESMTQVGADFLDYKRSSNSVHNRLQSQVWGLQEGGQPRAVAGNSSYRPETGTVRVAGSGACTGVAVGHPAGMPAHALRHHHASLTLPHMAGAAPVTTAANGYGLPPRTSGAPTAFAGYPQYRPTGA